MKYIMMGNWTDQGRKTVKDAKKRVEIVRNLIKEKNGSLSPYFTMGEYDVVAIIDMPNEESMIELLMKLNSMGNLKTKTLKAWDDTEFDKIVSGI